MKLFCLLIILSTAASAGEYRSYDGIRIHSSCIESFGPSFPELVHSGLNEGLQCLRALKLEGTAAENLRRLGVNYSSKLMIACHEPSTNFSPNADAHGSLRDGQTEVTTGLVHPYFSINPKFQSSLKNRPEYFKSVMFHETIHNLGYSHGDDVEYAFACEECCFNDDPEVKTAACKVCSSEYKESILDEKYAKDLYAMIDVSDYWEAFRAGFIFRKGVMAKPQSQLFHDLLLKYDRSANPLSIATAIIWDKLLPSPYMNIEKEKPLPEIIRDFATTAAEARSALFDENDLDKAFMIYLELNIQQLSEFKLIDERQARHLGVAVLEDMDSVWKKFAPIQKTKLDLIYRQIKDVTLD